MNSFTSIIIPVGKNEKKFHYIKTIEALIETAQEPIEILFLADGWNPNIRLLNKYSQVKVVPSKKNLGERQTVNRGAKIAKGDYILKIDAHCDMSKDWDIKLKKACSNKTLLVCTLDALDR